MNRLIHTYSQENVQKTNVLHTSSFTFTSAQLWKYYYDEWGGSHITSPISDWIPSSFKRETGGKTFAFECERRLIMHIETFHQWPNFEKYANSSIRKVTLTQLWWPTILIILRNSMIWGNFENIWIRFMRIWVWRKFLVF